MGYILIDKALYVAQCALKCGFYKLFLYVFCEQIHLDKAAFSFIFRHILPHVAIRFSQFCGVITL